MTSPAMFPAVTGPLNDRTNYKRISDLNPTIDANAKLTKGDKIAVP